MRAYNARLPMENDSTSTVGAVYNRAPYRTRAYNAPLPMEDDGICVHPISFANILCACYNKHNQIHTEKDASNNMNIGIIGCGTISGTVGAVYNRAPYRTRAFKARLPMENDSTSTVGSVYNRAPY